MKQNTPQNNLKICAVICEYNPFHNGHLYQLKKLQECSGCDAILCLMSGNYTQRGEAAILDKHTRAAHAVYAGAHCVIELPLPFATANAEIFALGAIKTLAAIPGVTTLAFGCECGHAQDFLNLAALLTQEPQPLKAAMKQALDEGESFAAARARALRQLLPEIDERLFSAPNNILALEYAKAVIRLKANIKLLPIQRLGAGYNDGALRGNYSSATAVRGAILKGGQDKKLADNLPAFVLRDLPLALREEGFLRLEKIEHYALLSKDKKEIALTCDCTEGLENRLKNMAQEYFSTQELLQQSTSRRYTAARLRRILLANALGVTAADTQRFLNENLYLNVLALNKENADMVLACLKQSPLPLLVRKGDEQALLSPAKDCYALTEKADAIYASLCERKLNGYAARFITPQP